MKRELYDGCENVVLSDISTFEMLSLAPYASCHDNVLLHNQIRPNTSSIFSLKPLSVQKATLYRDEPILSSAGPVGRGAQQQRPWGPQMLIEIRRCSTVHN